MRSSDLPALKILAQCMISVEMTKWSRVAGLGSRSLFLSSIFHAVFSPPLNPSIAWVGM